MNERTGRLEASPGAKNRQTKAQLSNVRSVGSNSSVVTSQGVEKVNIRNGEMKDRIGRRATSVQRRDKEASENEVKQKEARSRKERSRTKRRGRTEDAIVVAAVSERGLLALRGGGRSMLAVNCHEMIYNSVLRSMDDIAQD